MNVELSYNNDTVSVVIDGNIDSSTRDELNNKFQEVTSHTDIKNANIDLKGVKSINSAGIGKLLKFYKHFDSIGGEFKIVHISNRLMSLFKDINLDKIISISE